MKLTGAQLRILTSSAGLNIAETGGWAPAWQFGTWRRESFMVLRRAGLLMACDGGGKPLAADDALANYPSTYRLTGKGRCIVLQHMIEQAEARRDALLTLKVSLREPA